MIQGQTFKTGSNTLKLARILVRFDHVAS
jgi:hypothetical protein